MLVSTNVWSYRRGGVAVSLFLPSKLLVSVSYRVNKKATNRGGIICIILVFLMNPREASGLFWWLVRWHPGTEVYKRHPGNHNL